MRVVLRSHTAISLFIGFLFFTPSIRAQQEAYDLDKKYEVPALQNDLAILKAALVKTHPGLYWHQSEKEFEERYNRIRSSINRPLRDREFYTLIMPLIASIRCSHTGLFLSRAFDRHFVEHQVKLMPFDVKIIGSKIYMAGNYTGDSTIAPGSQILSINGISADSILGVMKPCTWNDGFVESYAMIEGDFNALLLIFGLFDQPDMYVLSTMAPSGEMRLIETAAVEQRILAQRAAQQAGRGQETFRLRIIDSLNTALLSLGDFESKGYHKFLAAAFKTIKQKGTQNLVIDLRGNGGGEDDYGRLLYSYITLKEFNYYDHLELTVDDPADAIFKYGQMPLGKLSLKYFHRFRLKRTGPGIYDLKRKAHPTLRKAPFKPRKDGFKGHVYVLVDGESYSATTEFCAVAQYNGRAKFIGRETGGGYCGNTSGPEFLLTLPATGIRAIIPLIRYEVAVKGPCGRGIQPDYPVEERMADHLLHRDADLLLALDLIRQLK